MEDWVNAEKYAKLAQTGYQVMTADEYTSHTEGFNTANESWMLATRNVATNTNIKDNDGDGSWGAKMTTEQGSGCGYGANYGYPLYIDRHLYETIPSTDCRKKCFVDFAVDSYTDENSILEALKVNTDYPELLKANKHSLGGITAKFKNAGGAAGVMDQYVGWCMDIPLMRVEEMKLIEAEAVGMQSGREAEGIQLLTTFAKTRDPQYVYGTHNEAYYNTSTSKFQNEVWWERRTEFWGEGLATYDIKRLKKGIIRSYENSNHPELYRWNMQETPEWMNRCLPRAETSYNTGITKNNPTPSAPVGDSPKYNW
jgi:starch-binding outer membrane protein, SusD/RagB family